MLKKTCTVLFLTWALFLSCGGRNNPTGWSRKAPVITTQPQSQFVHRDSSVTFTVAAIGSPAPTYQWRRNDTVLAGKTSASCTIAAAAFADSGSYSVVISNSEGSVTSDPAMLAVYLITISVQPASDTVHVDSPFTLTAVPVGIPDPATYQWRLTGFDLAGATNATYSIDSASTDDAGVYHAIVTCPRGTVYSDSVTLIVVP